MLGAFRFSTDIALGFSTWLFGSFYTVGLLLIFWTMRDDIAKHVSDHAKWWNTTTDKEFKKTTELKAKMMLLVWMILAIIGVVDTTYLQLVNPGGIGFMSSYFLTE